nr:MAG TPA: hypothetical protein [Bacteriophage sp.]
MSYKSNTQKEKRPKLGRFLMVEMRRIELLYTLIGLKSFS